MNNNYFTFYCKDKSRLELLKWCASTMQDLIQQYPEYSLLQHYTICLISKNADKKELSEAMTTNNYILFYDEPKKMLKVELFQILHVAYLGEKKK